MIDRPPPQLDELRERMSQLQPPAGMRERVLRAVEQGQPEQTSRRPALILVMRWAALLLPALATAAVASIAARHFGWFGRGPTKPAVIEQRDTPREKAPAPQRRHRHQAATPRTVPDAGPAVGDAGAAPVAATAESQTEQPLPAITLPRTNGKRRSSAAPHRRLAAAPAVSQQPRTPPTKHSTAPPTASPSAPPLAPSSPSSTSVQPAPSKREPAPIPPSALAEQVVAYRRALALSKTNPKRAAAEWQKQLARWPDGPLAHEVELQLIDSLVRAGKTRQARAAARRFLERHPDSPRSAAVRAILDPGRPAR